MNGIIRNSVVVTMLGARMHYAVPATLERMGLLSRFFTDAYIFPQSTLFGCLSYANKLPKFFRHNLIASSFSRYEKSIPKQKITNFDLLGISSILGRNLVGSQSQKDKINLWTGRRFCEKIIKNGLPSETRFLYTYKTAGLELIEFAKKNNIVTAVEQTIAPKMVEYEILNEEFASWSHWQDRIDLGLVDLMAKRESEEWSAANYVVCGSEFVADGLLKCGVDRAKCKVIPYAINLGSFTCDDKDKYDGRRPLRLLFAGEVGLRKGIQYLFGALKRLNTKNIDCKVVGGIAIKTNAVKELSRFCEVLGQVPKSEMPKLFHWADVFVLPTLCEGSATVTYEALACGVPVVTTRNSGSVVRHGKDGLICEIRNADHLAENIEKLLGDISIVNDFSNAARIHAQDYSWSSYGKRLSEFVKESLCC